MSRPRRHGRSFGTSLAGLAAALLLVAGIAPALPAQDRADTQDRADKPPTLAVSAHEPLPAALRRSVPESVEELKAIEERVRGLVDELQAVTVGVRRGSAQGTGVIVSEDGYVLTAAHVSGPPGRPVTLIRNDGSTLDAVSLGRHSELDAGLIRITERGRWPVAKVGDLSHLREGDWVIGTGHPGGFDGRRLPPVRLGRVIGKMRSILHTDVMLVGGDSGGPLFDLNGRVVGIHSRIGPGAELNFHVPITAYTENWYWMTRSEDRPVETNGGGPMLGVDGRDTKDGCLVTRVSPDTPADRAGLKEGDLITRIDDRFIFGLEDLVSSVNQYDAGDEVRITYHRDGDRRTTRVTLAERPQREDRPRRRSRRGE